MTLDDINCARDAIAARAVYGDDTRDSMLTQAATDARSDYVRLSLDPKFGWAAALNEAAKLHAENLRLQDEVDAARKRGDVAQSTLNAFEERSKRMVSMVESLTRGEAP